MADLKSAVGPRLLSISGVLGPVIGAGRCEDEK